MAVSEFRKRTREAEHLFAGVVGLDPEQRETKLERACHGDPQLLREVQDLLDQHDAGEQLQTPRGHPRPPNPIRIPQPRVGQPGAQAPMQRSDDETAGGGETVAGRYRLVAELGRGAMGVVYKAYDSRLDRFVALKFLSAHLGADTHARARLTAEAKAVSALDHPHICTLHEIGEDDDGQVFLVMTHYEGRPLRRLIEQGPLPLEKAVRLAADLASGLSAAHRRGIVHRDVKPSNLLVTDDGRIKILDFGIAKVAGQALTRTGVTLGTLGYMSPEQLSGEVDARTDVWALGVVLFEMLTGERPFCGDYDAALVYAILHEDPAPLSQFRSDVPSTLTQVVRRCLTKSPDERYQSAAEVEVDLRELSQAEPSPELPSPPPTATRPFRRHMRWALPGLGVVAVLLALIVPQLLSVVPLRFSETPSPPLPRLALMPLSVWGADASVGEEFTVALRDLLAQLGTGASTPFTVVSATEMRDVPTVEGARGTLGVERLLTGDLYLQDGRARLVLVGPGISVVADGAAGRLETWREGVVNSLVEQLGVEPELAPRPEWGPALASIERALREQHRAESSNDDATPSGPFESLPEAEPARPAANAPPPNSSGEKADTTPTASGLAFDLWTNKGRGTLAFAGGDTMEVYVKTNRPAYVRIVNRLADGRRVVLEDNLYISERSVHNSLLVGAFVCTPPFGDETILAFARSEPFPPLRTVTVDNYRFLEEDLETYAARTRGFKKVSVLQDEAQLRVVTRAE